MIILNSFHWICYLGFTAVTEHSWFTVKPAFNGHPCPPPPQKKCTLYRGGQSLKVFQSKLVFKLILPDIVWPLLTGGRYSEVNVNTVLTVSVNRLQLYFDWQVWIYLLTGLTFSVNRLQLYFDWHVWQSLLTGCNCILIARFDCIC